MIELERAKTASDYFDKKFDRNKQKALFPRETLHIILNNSSVYSALINQSVDGLEHLIRDVEQVLQYGAKKYSPNSWKTVPNAKERYWSAYVRHITAKDEADEESDLPHTSHALCNLVFLLWLEEDNRHRMVTK